MAEDSARVSDHVLLERMRAGTTDSSMYVWLLAPLVTIPVAVAYGERAALVAMLGSLAACVILLQLRDAMPRFQAARAAEREFRRRFRLYDLKGYEAEAIASLAKPSAPEVILLFAGQSLLHGLHHFVRIDLGNPSRLQVRRAPMLSDALKEEAATKLFRYDQPLSAAQEQRARELVATLTAEKLAPPKQAVVDGFPCQACIMRRAHEPIWTELNMAELAPEISEHPAVRFLRLFIELEDEVS